MTREQLDRESDQYDSEFSALHAKRAVNRIPHPPKTLARQPRRRKSA
jgi:hypothetical protein